MMAWANRYEFLLRNLFSEMIKHWYEKVFTQGDTVPTHLKIIHETVHFSEGALPTILMAHLPR